MFIVAWLPGVCAWSAAAYAYLRLPLWLFLPLSPAILTLVLCVAIALLRLPVPRPKAGRYPRPPLSLRWQWALERAARNAGLQYLLRAFYATRYLHLRALGARAALSIHCSLDVTLSGVSLLSIGPKATLALFSTVTTCDRVAGETLIAPVSIGREAFVGKSARMGPGCALGDGAFLGIMNALENGEHLAPGERIADYTRLRAVRA